MKSDAIIASLWGLEPPTRITSAQPIVEAALLQKNVTDEDVALDKEGAKLSAYYHKLHEAGGLSNDALALCSFEDLESFGLPKLIAKQVAEIYRRKPDTKDANGPVSYHSDKAASRMTTKQLVESYDPKEPDNAVGKRLKEISKGQRFLIFDKNAAVDVENSIKLLEELRMSFPEREIFTIGGVVFKLYRVGDRVDDWVEENPLYPGRPLRPDGTCDQLNRSWDGVPLEVRQLVRVVSDHNTGNMDNFHDWMDWALSDTKRFSVRFPKQVALYEELKANGGLPKLRIKLSAIPQRKNDPFHRTY
jgi:hypothetical protein